MSAHWSGIPFPPVPPSRTGWENAATLRERKFPGTGAPGPHRARRIGTPGGVCAAPRAGAGTPTLRIRRRNG